MMLRLGRWGRKVRQTIETTRRVREGMCWLHGCENASAVGRLECTQHIAEGWWLH